MNTIVGVVAGAAGLSIGFVFMWWAGRKVARMMFSAFRKGRLSI